MINLICRYSPKANSAKRRPIAHTRFILRFCASDNVTLQLLRQKPGREPCTQRCLYSRDWQATAPTKRVHSAKPVTGDQWLRTTHKLGPITAQPLAHVVQSDSSTWVNTLKSWLDTIGQEWIISTSLPKIYPSMREGRGNVCQLVCDFLMKHCNFSPKSRDNRDRTETDYTPVVF